MQRISPYLWFDKEAGEAAKLYASVFKGARIVKRAIMSDTPSGDVEVVVLDFGDDQLLKLMSAGPYFKINPSISFLVSCATPEEVDAAWKGLSPGGTPMMELGSYPFSGRYGWIQDRYGVSWQLMLKQSGTTPRRLTPTLMYVGEQCGKAEEAMRLYASFFKNSRVGEIMRYGPGDEPDKAGTVQHGEFVLDGQPFAAMDSALEHAFTFSEGVSFEVECATQAEIDHLWKLSAVPEAEQCGWLKDRFGVSWQIVPAALEDMVSDPDKAKAGRATQAFLQMKKFDIAALEAAYRG